MELTVQAFNALLKVAAENERQERLLEAYIARAAMVEGKGWSEFVTKLGG